MIDRKSNRSVVIGLSGGVDSAVSAQLLLEQGWQVTALFMKNWEEDDDAEYCAAAADLADCESVCDTLGIELETINFATEYWDRVFANFLEELRLGHTPNPDVLCNREIKFREFFAWAKTLGADFVATGHYARIAHDDDRWRLLRGIDSNKDQSYFLHAIDPAVLPLVKFPVGELCKSEVRRKASELGLKNHDKKDSTGICFIGERRFREFVARYLPLDKGPIENLEGDVIGEHLGIAGYTLGQRHGLGIGGAGEAWFVAAKDVARNALIAVQGHDHPALFTSCVHTHRVNWLSAPPKNQFRCTAKTRYRQTDAACEIVCRDGGRLDITFDEPQRAVTPGQSIVFYQGDTCVGGAVIESTYNAPRAVPLAQ